MTSSDWLLFQVPYEVLSYIDQSRNPLLYNKDCYDRARQKDEEVRKILINNNAVMIKMMNFIAQAGRKKLNFLIINTF